MKHQLRWNIIITLFLFFTLLGQQNVTAQDTIKSISINLQLTHFIAKDFDNNNNSNNYYFTPISPGIEILYKYPLDGKTSISTGINYSFSHWKYNFTSGNQGRRLAHEVAIPLLL